MRTAQPGAAHDDVDDNNDEDDKYDGNDDDDDDNDDDAPIPHSTSVTMNTPKNVKKVTLPNRPNRFVLNRQPVNLDHVSIGQGAGAGGSSSYNSAYHSGQFVRNSCTVGKGVNKW